jgi:murein DD-endopeptidase MepM/ murein hydrolase activator NlpD
MRKILILLTSLAFFATLSSAQTLVSSGHDGHDTHDLCLTESERESIKTTLRQNIARLEREGKILPPSEQIVALDWVLKPKSTMPYSQYYIIGNYVDQDATASVKDFNCGTKTYNGHKGTDIGLFPFAWNMMDNNYVDIVAGAAGVIINKIDGNVDRNCSFTGTWNAVFIRHDDGSVAWYGHMKKNSLTTKAIGDRVAKGEFLGLVGSSGQSTGPHLHLELYANAAQTTLVEPSAGTCNVQSNGTTSWWASQKPHKEPAISAVLTHGAPPQLFFECPSDRDKMNLKSQFQLLDTVTLAGYFRDQTAGQFAIFTLRQPNGGTVPIGTSNFTQNFNVSWWWYRIVLPLSAPIGTWKLEVTHNNTTVTQDFFVGTKVSTKDFDNQQIKVFPNPASDVLNIENEGNATKEIRIFNSIGQAVGHFQNVNNTISLVGLPSGFYTAEIRLEGQVVVRSFVKK